MPHGPSGPRIREGDNGAPLHSIARSVGGLSPRRSSRGSLFGCCTRRFTGVDQVSGTGSVRLDKDGRPPHAISMKCGGSSERSPIATGVGTGHADPDARPNLGGALQSGCQMANATQGRAAMRRLRGRERPRATPRLGRPRRPHHAQGEYEGRRASRNGVQSTPSRISCS
jgi:hypothetical protein